MGEAWTSEPEVSRLESTGDPRLLQGQTEEQGVTGARRFCFSFANEDDSDVDISLLPGICRGDAGSKGTCPGQPCWAHWCLGVVMTNWESRTLVGFPSLMEFSLGSLVFQCSMGAYIDSGFSLKFFSSKEGERTFSSLPAGPMQSPGPCGRRGDDGLVFALSGHFSGAVSVLTVFTTQMHLFISFHT